MPTPPSTDHRPSAVEPLQQRRRLPAWLLSGGIHALIVVLLATFVTVAPGTPQGDSDRPGGLVLVQDSPQGEREYFDESAATTDQAQANSTSAAALGVEAALPDAESLPFDLAGGLPTEGSPVGLAGDIGDALPGDLDKTSQGGGSRGDEHGYVRTGVFGLYGEGSRFVYVFDRSGSMAGYQARPMQAAKRELIASLEDLQAVNQFQIIFYNERPYICNPRPGSPPRMLFGREQDKQVAVDFIASITPAGGTRHLDALLQAVALGPDAIFFLTDADEPQLTPQELELIRRRNNRQGAVIHAVEFGAGPSTGDRNFLMRLAEQNGGQHTYVDVTRLPLND